MTNLIIILSTDLKKYIVIDFVRIVQSLHQHSTLPSILYGLTIFLIEASLSIFHKMPISMFGIGHLFNASQRSVVSLLCAHHLTDVFSPHQQWTTDEDLTEAIRSIGITDVLEIKFFENRANGQSKGLGSTLYSKTTNIVESVY